MICLFSLFSGICAIFIRHVGQVYFWPSKCETNFEITDSNTLLACVTLGKPSLFLMVKHYGRPSSPLRRKMSVNAYS